MFGRLLKQQLKSTYKEFNILYVSIIIVGILSAICIKLQSDIFIIIFALLLGTALTGSSICYIVFSCKMLYTSVYEKQGYLTFTLPISPHALIISKILAILLYGLGFILSFILAIIACSLVVDFSYIKEVGMVLQNINEAIIKNPLLVLVVLLNTLISLCSFLMLIEFIFAFANTGIVFRNKRGLGVVILYLVINFVISMIGIFDPIDIIFGYIAGENKFLFYNLNNIENDFRYTNIFSVWNLIINLLIIGLSYVGAIRIFNKKLEL